MNKDNHKLNKSKTKIKIKTYVDCKYTESLFLKHLTHEIYLRTRVGIDVVRQRWIGIWGIY